ncbi:hypothetical protein BKA62DRAFT_757297 [Auriculariales sp. MPI-PUGE-AT-0066]|nr:hypothetical protein BKA62DRAFT_763811 [Auriculariales sp. MPI-PUGE-AT-0066]KAH7066005.1 hypothetical protein BKA62DRAFT_763372 [Auriculariales sp. MPI-PUGE-AT-0066]KAH7066006.1 hypothetical protein BKA62DRAFT_763373 [Auriculariales sp. MPI-PUGE-AT-0066]KAH7097158.1 hypothetical protein BKA62DRAFT_760130 [Auriculariales sp. MPI-PUGE-AT-0066]KAH7097159.1 hypothetical protein BKA62DRAFT_760131 [Auriculariales sp. MPI-PUGE-AT-0066]
MGDTPALLSDGGTNTVSSTADAVELRQPRQARRGDLGQATAHENEKEKPDSTCGTPLHCPLRSARIPKMVSVPSTVDAVELRQARQARLEGLLRPTEFRDEN